MRNAFLGKVRLNQDKIIFRLKIFRFKIILKNQQKGHICSVARCKIGLGLLHRMVILMSIIKNSNFQRQQIPCFRVLSG